jgi:hypothetical protein
MGLLLFLLLLILLLLSLVLVPPRALKKLPMPKVERGMGTFLGTRLTLFPFPFFLLVTAVKPSSSVLADGVLPRLFGLLGVLLTVGVAGDEVVVVVECILLLLFLPLALPPMFLLLLLWLFWLLFWLL